MSRFPVRTILYDTCMKNLMITCVMYDKYPNRVKCCEGRALQKWGKYSKCVFECLFKHFYCEERNEEKCRFCTQPLPLHCNFVDINFVNGV